MVLGLPTMLVASHIGSASNSRRLDRAGIQLSYLWRHGRLPRLDDPRLFTEWVQHRKLNDRDHRLPILADKYAVKAWVASKLSSSWVIPTLWHGAVLPSDAVWPTPFVVKSRHGCNQTRFVFENTAHWLSIRRDSARWMKSRYGRWLSEWLYGDIPRGLLVEPFIGEGATQPIDYKFYVFGGRVEYVQVHLGRGSRHRWIVLDRAWRRLSASSEDADPARPRALTQMVAGAEILGQGFTFVRVDLYDGVSGPLFGEMTFYPGSGLDRFNPISLDERMGCDWRLAVRRSGTELAA
jgi:hypothetical protein